MHDLSKLLLRFEPEPDVNTSQGFAEILAEQAGDEAKQRLEEIGEVSPDRDVSSALEIESSERPRNEHGQFAKAEPESPPEEPEAVAPEEPAEPAAPAPAPEPEPTPAERQLEEANSFIGKQANEIGSLRDRERELSERLAKIEGRMEERDVRPVQQAPSTGDLDARIERSGAAATMRYVIENQLGEDAVDYVLDEWHDEDPIQAIQFAAKKAAFEASSVLGGQGQQQQAAELPPELQTAVRERQIAESAAQARSEMGDEAWKIVEPVLTKTLAEAPKEIQEMVLSSDPTTRVSGIKVVAELAKGRVIADATTKAQGEAEQQTVAAKQAAQVATGSQRPVTPGKTPDGEKSDDERLKEFYDAFSKTETTSVQDGLRLSS